MNRRAFLASSASALAIGHGDSLLASAAVPSEKQWTNSPLQTFSHCSVYDHDLGGSISYIQTKDGEKVWFRADNAAEFSYRPEIHISPNERFALMVQKCGSTHIGIHVFEIDPHTFALTRRCSLWDDAQTEILRFLKRDDKFHHFDLAFVTWSVTSDSFLMTGSGQAFKFRLSAFMLSVSVPKGEVASATGFGDHNQKALEL